jgi:hypothetical protein
MKTFNQYQAFLIEDTKASTYFEGVLVDCWNLGYKEAKFKEKILTSPNTKAFLALKKSGWGTTGKTRDEQKQILWNLARLMHKKINLTGNADKAGQSKMGVSTFWSQGKPRGYEGTGKGVDTSKADITIGKKGISVKGPSAQLMSGEQKEARATVISAVDYMGGNEYIKKQLMKEVNNFITNTRTIGAEWTAGAIKKATPEQIKASGNESAREAVEKQEETKKNTNDVFKRAFNNPKVAHAFAWEAMTGWEKFGGKTYGDAGGGKEGEATAMLVWDYDMKKLIYHHITPKAPYVATIASRMKMAADIKSGHYNVKGVKAGYSFYQTVRLTYNTVFKKTDEFNEAYDHAVDKQHSLLAEGKINEFKLKATLVKMKDWLMSKMTKLWDWAATMMTKLKERVIKILEQSVDVIMNFFDVEVNVRVKTTVRM